MVAPLQLLRLASGTAAGQLERVEDACMYRLLVDWIGPRPQAVTIVTGLAKSYRTQYVIALGAAEYKCTRRVGESHRGAQHDIVWSAHATRHSQPPEGSLAVQRPEIEVGKLISAAERVF
jgi:hypothetical protein